MADDLEAALVGASAQPLGDGCRAGAGAPHEHAALEHILVDDAQKREPGEHQAGKSEYPGETENAASHEERRCQIENQAQGAFGHQHGNQQAGRDTRESRALPQLIQAHRHEAEQEHAGDQQCPWPYRVHRRLEGAERAGKAGKTRQDRAVDAEHDDAQLGDRQQRKAMDMPFEQAKRERARRGCILNPMRPVGQRLRRGRIDQPMRPDDQRPPRHCPPPRRKSLNTYR